MNVEKIKTYVKEHTKVVASVIGIGIPAALLFLGGYIITTAVIFAAISVAALGIIVWKLKSSDSRIAQFTYDMIAGHPILSDIGFTLIVYMASPGGVTGMLGAAVACVMASAILIIMGDYHENQRPHEIREGKVFFSDTKDIQLSKEAYCVRS